MRKPIAQDINRQNLIDVSKELQGCEYFPFFGTLLGLTRDADIIPHDDDVDIYVNISQRNEVIDRLARSGFTIDHADEVNSSPWFMQAKRSVEDPDSYVDFYFYEVDTERNHLVERWNFTGVWTSVDNHIHIPASLIYPLKSSCYFETKISMPADPEGCCEYLYGSEWRRPLVKQLGYTTQIRDHVPSVEVKPNQFAEIIRHFHAIDDALQLTRDELSSTRERLAELEACVERMEATWWWKAREVGVKSLSLAAAPLRRFKS